MPASAARSSASCATAGLQEGRGQYGAGWQRTSPLAGAAVVVEGLNIAKRHTKPRPSAGPDRPPAAHPAGRHPRHRPAARHQQRHGHLPAAATSRRASATRRSPTAAASGSAAHCGEPMRGEKRERPSSASGTSTRSCRRSEGVRVRQPDAGAAPDQDRRQHRPRRGTHERQGDRRRRRRPRAHHRPEAGRDPGPAVDRQFRLRTGNPIGVKVTLRGERMWDFLERLTRLALPRIRDFRGVPAQVVRRARQLLARPARAARVPGDRLRQGRPPARARVSIVTTAKTDEESQAAAGSSSACPSPARREEENRWPRSR